MDAPGWIAVGILVVLGIVAVCTAAGLKRSWRGSADPLVEKLIGGILGGALGLLLAAVALAALFLGVARVVEVCGGRAGR